MSKKLADHLIKTNYNGINDKIKSYRKPKKKNIVTHLLNGDIKLAKIKSKLFLKYNRRLKYLGL